MNQVVIDQETLTAAHCERDFACLSDTSVCETVLFTHRDVEVVKCLGKSPCGKRMSCAGMQICTCPVKKRLHGLRSRGHC
jgi:hypothetical protein